MPGRLRSSFRSGNLAEHLGLLLLKGIAAVLKSPGQRMLAWMLLQLCFAAMATATVTPKTLSLCS